MATSLKMDDALKNRMRHLAHRCHRWVHWIMCAAISQCVEREARESFKKEALASWADYQETGLHLTSQEVRAWLNTWGTEEEAAASECRR